jgi:hypothetical protein
MQIVDSTFSFCVIDTQSQRCLLLESYQLPNSPDKSLKDQLKSIFEDHHFLMAGFWKTVKISTYNKQFSFVPYPLFDESAIDSYLQVVAPFDSENESIYHYKHELPESVNVFAVNSDLIDWIKAFYPPERIKVIHQTSALIQAVMKDHQSMSLKSMYLLVYKNFFTLVVKNENSLEYCNVFSYSSAEELYFYLIFITSTLNINRKTTKLLIFGDIDKDSELFGKISEQFKFISFGNKPSYLKYGYVFDEISDHYFFDLFSIYLC